jgi:hypothetical protein
MSDPFLVIIYLVLNNLAQNSREYFLYPVVNFQHRLKKIPQGKNVIETQTFHKSQFSNRRFVLQNFFLEGINYFLAKSVDQMFFVIPSTLGKGLQSDLEFKFFQYCCTSSQLGGHFQNFF